MKYRIILLLLTALVLNAHAQLTDWENYTTTQKGRFLLCTLIGSNVTNQTSEGAVTIENGSTVITNHNDVIITSDFEVKPGAEFEIRINNQNQVTL